MTAPRLSIGIPTVDRLPYLREAVASAQAQRAAPLEILIADDGDSPAIRDWASRVAAGDRRVRYLRTPGRLGLAGAWNHLADEATGEFLTIIGDDDRLLPEFAGRLLNEATPDVAVVFSNHYVIDASGRRLIDLYPRRRWNVACRLPQPALWTNRRDRYERRECPRIRDARHVAAGNHVLAHDMS